MNIDHPLHLDARGRTAETDGPDHLRDLIEQLLLTSPGERVMRPDFGCGLRDVLFGPLTRDLAATTEVVVQGSLERYLGDLIAVDRIEVAAVDSALEISVTYRERATAQSRSALVVVQGAIV